MFNSGFGTGSHCGWKDLKKARLLLQEAAHSKLSKSAICNKQTYLGLMASRRGLEKKINSYTEQASP